MEPDAQTALAGADERPAPSRHQVVEADRTAVFEATVRPCYAPLVRRLTLVVGNEHDAQDFDFGEGGPDAEYSITRLDASAIGGEIMDDTEEVAGDDAWAPDLEVGWYGGIAPFTWASP